MSAADSTTVQNDKECRTDSNKAWLEAVMKKVSRDEEVLKIVSYKSEKGTQKGDNYTSDITRTTMDVITGSGRQKRISVMIKELPCTEYRRVIFSEMNIFLREMTMYREVLPNMEDVQNEYSDYSDLLWGKCFDLRTYDRIVLEDITKCGFKMNDRRQGLDFQHCLLVIKSLAKFHALSLKLKSKQLIPLDIFGTALMQREPTKTQFSGLFTQMLDRLAENMESKWGPEWKSAVDRIKLLQPVFMEKVLSVMERDQTRFNVLNHGDCWLNNMMFKYGIDSDKPITVKFVDYQLCYYNSPALDLQYFLSTSTNYDVRVKHKSTLIEEYHKSLMNFLKLYNYNEKIITLDELNDELKRVLLFSLVSALMLLPLMLIEKVEHVPDVEELCKEQLTSEGKEIKSNWAPELGDTFATYMKLIVKELIDANQI